MGEPLPQKLDRLVTDIEKLNDLYDYAEKVYPYSKIRTAYSVCHSPILQLNIFS